MKFINLSDFLVSFIRDLFNLWCVRETQYATFDITTESENQMKKKIMEMRE